MSEWRPLRRLPFFPDFRPVRNGPLAIELPSTHSIGQEPLLHPVRYPEALELMPRQLFHSHLDSIYHPPAESVNHHLARAGEFSTGIMRNPQLVLTGLEERKRWQLPRPPSALNNPCLHPLRELAEWGLKRVGNFP